MSPISFDRSACSRESYDDVYEPRDTTMCDYFQVIEAYTQGVHGVEGVHGYVEGVHGYVEDITDVAGVAGVSGVAGVAGVTGVAGVVVDVKDAMTSRAIRAMHAARARAVSARADMDIDVSPRMEEDFVWDFPRYVAVNRDEKYNVACRNVMEIMAAV